MSKVTKLLWEGIMSSQPSDYYLKITVGTLINCFSKRVQSGQIFLFGFIKT